MDHSSAKSFIKEKTESFNNQIEDFDKKRRLAWKLHDNYKEEDFYVETLADDIEFLEGPELEELEKVLVGIEKVHSIWTTLGLTFFCLLIISPVFFIHSIKEYNYFYVFLALYTFGVLGIVSIWRKYFKDLKEHRAEVLEKNKREWMIFPVFIIFILVYGLLTIGSEKLISFLFLPKNWLFFERGSTFNIILVYVIIIPAIFLLSELLAIVKKEEGFLHKVKKKHKIFAFVFWMLAIYFIGINFTSVSDDQIRFHSPLKPLGKPYKFNQIESIKAAFEDKDGDFYYTVIVDGKEAKFSTPTVNDEIERYMEDTYLELEDFDQKLINLGVKKESSEENVEKNYLDKKYVDRFLRIVKNLPN